MGKLCALSGIPRPTTAQLEPSASRNHHHHATLRLRSAPRPPTRASSVIIMILAGGRSLIPEPDPAPAAPPVESAGVTDSNADLTADFIEATRSSYDAIAPAYS